MTETTATSPKTILLDAAKNLVSDIEKGDILTAAWASRRVEELITDPDTLEAYGFKLDSSDIMRPRLVKIEAPTSDDGYDAGLIAARNESILERPSDLIDDGIGLRARGGLVYFA